MRKRPGTWTHPDRIDEVASQGPDDGSPPASAEEVERVLYQALLSGGLKRVPKKPRARGIVLAVLCLRLRRHHPYSEPELNFAIQAALEHLNAGVDHVTCRRYLIDLGFLKRDRAGSRYLLNYPRLETTLSARAAKGAEAFLKRHGA